MSRFLKTHPFALKSKVETFLNMQRMAIISPVRGGLATPVVPAIKRNEFVRLWSTYKLTLNHQVPSTHYLLPRIDELMADLSCGRLFANIDFSRAYQQAGVDEESCLLMINMHKELYEVNRLRFGITPAPVILQRLVDTMLGDLPGVTCYLDDILMTGRIEDRHVRNFKCSLERLQDHGGQVRKGKSVACLSSTCYI